MLARNDRENVESLKGYQVPLEDKAMVALIAGSRDGHGAEAERGDLLRTIGFRRPNPYYRHPDLRDPRGPEGLESVPRAFRAAHFSDRIFAVGIPKQAWNPFEELDLLRSCQTEKLPGLGLVGDGRVTQTTRLMNCAREGGAGMLEN